MVSGQIVRTTIVNLTALRAIGCGPGDATVLRRYILGLTLVAALAPVDFFLRQGCLLVRDSTNAPTSVVVYRNGEREDVYLD